MTSDGDLFPGFTSHRVSTRETEIRCVVFEIGITASVLRAFMSSTDTVPGPTLAV